MSARRTEHDDDGFVLPLVMLIALLLMIGTATMLGVVANNAGPARRAQDQEAALAAAQAGVQAYVASLNANCANYDQVTTSYTVQECSWPASAAATPYTSARTGAPVIGTGTYSVQATNTAGFLSSNEDDLRIVSTGSANGTSAKLLADVSGVPNVLRFAYFSNHESVDPRLLTSYFPVRTIPFTIPSTLSLLGITLTTGQQASVLWPAASAPQCGALWYDDPTNPTTLHLGRSHAGDSATQTGTITPTGTGLTASLTQQCSVTMTNGMTFDGPVYSHDAYYFSSSLPTNSTGPTFTIKTPCGPVTSNCEPLPPASSAWSTGNSPVAPTSPYRSFSTLLPGTPSGPVGPQTVQTSHFDVTLPSTTTQTVQALAAAAAVATCTYSSDVTLTLNAAGTAVTVSGTGATGQLPACTSVAVGKTTLYVNGTATIPAGGKLTAGKLSVVATQDIVLGGSLTTSAAAPAGLSRNQFAEHYIDGVTPAIDLVAQNNVRMAHTVTCAPGDSAVSTTGYCSNDISGLYTTDQAAEVANADGTLKPTHPARQYCNSVGDTSCGGTSNASSTCGSGTGASTPGVTVSAAIFALTGSFQTDNYSRGCALGTLTVNGGIYTNFRGPLGQEWEVPTQNASIRSYSGYKLQLNYVSLEKAGLAFVPPLEGGSSYHPWQLLAVSTLKSGSGS